MGSKNACATYIHNITYVNTGSRFLICHCTKKKFSIQNFFSRSDKIRSFLEIWSHLLNKSLMENFIFCAVYIFSYCHNRSFRESSMGFFSLLVSMAGVVCFLLSCRTDKGDSLQQYRKQM